MTYFETIGVDYQYHSTNIHEAERSFKKSCNKCTTRGMHIECDRCAIASVHGNILEYFKLKKGDYYA